MVIETWSCRVICCEKIYKREEGAITNFLFYCNGRCKLMKYGHFKSNNDASPLQSEGHRNSEDPGLALENEDKSTERG